LNHPTVVLNRANRLDIINIDKIIHLIMLILLYTRHFNIYYVNKYKLIHKVLGTKKMEYQFCFLFIFYI